MREHLDLGSTPADEPCAQVGSDDYQERARKETRAYVNQLRRMFGPEPEGSKIAAKSNPHDYGSYFSVVVYYDPKIPASIDYAFNVENNLPGKWDEEARKELIEG